MRRNRNLFKVIISFVCIFAIVAASVISAIFISKNNENKNNNNKNGGSSDYLLTSEQRLLASEINNSAKAAVSENKKKLLLFNQTGVEASSVSYFNDSVFTVGNINDGLQVFVLDEDSVKTNLVDQLVLDDVVDDDYLSFNYSLANKNIFALVFEFASNNYRWVICSVKNHNVNVITTFDVVDISGTAFLNDDYFSIVFGSNFYAVLLKTGETYNYELFEYVDDISSYDSFKFEIDDVSCVDFSGTFIFQNKLTIKYTDFSSDVICYSSESKFYEKDASVIIDALSLEKGKILEIKNISDTASELAVKDSNKYISYSYKLVVDGKTDKILNLGEYSKLSVAYSGEKYFAVYVQKVDESNNLVSSGKMIYFDYDANIIASYDVESISSTLLLSYDNVFLTKDGMISSKSSVNCSKIYDFDSNGYEFHDVLAKANSFILKNLSDEFVIFDSSLNSLILHFDDYKFINDDLLILTCNGKYFLYNTLTRSNTEIKYVNTSLVSNTSMYIVEKSDSIYSIYSGSTLFADDIVSYTLNDKYLSLTNSSETKTYFFVDNIDGVNTYSSQDLGEEYLSESLVENYDAPAVDPFVEDDSYYYYDDKIISQNGSTSDTVVVKATHCITGGLYSKTSYVDYFELHYYGEGSGSDYIPYRIYYKVDIDETKGTPTLKIISHGHHYLGYKEVDSSTPADDYTLQVNDKKYSINLMNNLFPDDGYPVLHAASGLSYDTISYTGGTTTYLYRYTGSSGSVYGLTLHKSTIDYEHVCTAEVYGNSIRVSLVFDFKSISGFGLNLALSHFGSERVITSVAQENYYNKLYYKTVVVGVNDQNVNYYSDIIENLNYYPLAEKFVSDTLTTLPTTSDLYRDITIYDNDSVLTKYTACVSNKIYLNGSGLYSVLYVGNKIKTNIVGAKIIGFTTINQANNLNVKNENLYNISTRSYRDESIMFRAYKYSAETSSNVTGIVDYYYMTQGHLATGETYNSLILHNDQFLYYSGGLNRYRYIYCVYEPEMFYLELDYNVSNGDDLNTTDDDNNFNSEIKYLKNYSGVNIGIQGNYDYLQYNKTWTYCNVDNTEFGNYSVDDKYEPYDFKNNTTRYVVPDIEHMDLISRETYLDSIEDQAVIFEYKGNKERYYYIIVDGVKYYLQKNTVTMDAAGTVTSSSMEPFYEMAAYDCFTVVKNPANLIYSMSYSSVGYINPILSDVYYDDGDSGYYYYSNIESFNIRIVPGDNDNFYARFHNKNLHERTSTYNGYYAYASNVITVANPTGPYNVTEKFSFYYTDDIVFTEVPTHIHYEFIGWKVYLGDYDTKVILTNCDNTNSFNININNIFSDGKTNYLAGNGASYFSTWKTADGTWLNTSSKPIRLVAQWGPAECEIEAVLWNKNENNKYVGLEFRENGSSYIILNNYVISSSLPNFKKSGESIDSQEPYGVLDYTINFDYSPTMTFADISQTMVSNGYTSSLIFATGLNCQFMGWAFQYKSTTEGDDSFYSIDASVDSVKSATLLSNYIGDTTKVIIYAYYSTSKYEMDLFFEPMGGATNSSVVNKNYVSDTDNIINNKSTPAIFTLEYKNSDGTSVTQKLTNGTIEGYTGISYVSDKKLYSTSINNFYAGSSIQFSVGINTEYYLKQFVVSNLVLKNNSNNFETFTATFTRGLDSLWSVSLLSSEGISENMNSSTNPDGYFKFGNSTYNYNNGLTDSHNLFKITQDNSICNIFVYNLSNPGELNYNSQSFSGTNGFNITFTFASYDLEIENISVHDDRNITENIDLNNAMLVSSQPLTNVRGDTLADGDDAFFWLGTSKYSWSNLSYSGYYKVKNTGLVETQPDNTMDYTTFINQIIAFNSDFYVYFDATEKIVYYPVQFTESDKVDWKSVRSKINTTSAYDFYITLNSMDYYFNHNTNATLENGKYYILRYNSDLTILNNLIINTVDENSFNNKDNYYDPNNTSSSDVIVVYYQNNKAYYKTANTNERSTNYEITLESSGKKTLAFRINAIESNLYYICRNALDDSIPKSGVHYYFVYRTTIATSTIELNATTYNNYISERDYYFGGNKDDNLYVKVDFTAQKVYYHVVDFIVGYNNTRMLAIDPGQSQVYYSESPNKTAKMQHYEIDYYISSIKIGTYTFSFKQITRDTELSAANIKTYGYFKLNNQINSNENVTHLTTNYTGTVFNYFGVEYTINDAYKLMINGDSGKIGAKTYYFYLTRDENGYTRYFIIYDEKTDKFNNTDTKVVYDISIEFTKYERNLSINVTETDLYDINESKNSFTVYQSLNSSNLYSSFSNIKAVNTDEIENRFYLTSELDDPTDPTITTLNWNFNSSFTPSMSRRLNISANSGYLIKKLVVKINDITLVTFEFSAGNSLDGLSYYSANWNYSYLNEGYPSILYNINMTGNKTIGYNTSIFNDSNNVFGFYYSSLSTVNWTTTQSNTYKFDQIYLFFGGIYEDISIDVETISYTEFVFENGESEINPLLRSNVTTTESGKEYKILSLSQTYLDFYTYLLNEEDDFEFDTSVRDDSSNYILRYYPTESSNGILAGTLRLLFIGTGSKIKYGIHFVATEDDYSVYFTSARYYNEPIGGSEPGQDAFWNLELYSGRTNSNERISNGNQDKFCKLVYMYTGYIFTYNGDGYFYANDYKNTVESNYKYFMATRVFINTIEVETTSYLFNKNLTNKDTHNAASQYTTSYDTTSYKYMFVDDGLKYIGYSNSVGQRQVYQLDNESKSESWFNDTVLTDISFNNNGVEKKWGNKLASDATKSEISKVAVGGFNFNWIYYEIPGYYLQYIMINIGDLETYYPINVPDMVKSNTIKTISSPFGFEYNFRLEYYANDNGTISYIKLCLVSYTANEGEIDKLKSVSLMSNNIQVSFISNAYTYNIVYNNYNYNSSIISTASSELKIKYLYEAYSAYNPLSLKTQQIYYDTMTTLQATEKLTGYTFIGWGSENYFRYISGSSTHEAVSRYTAGNGLNLASTWNTTSSWFDVSGYLGNANNTANLYDAYKVYGMIKPGSAFYVDGGYFVTDTGYSSSTNSLCQNYNFFSNYIMTFFDNIASEFANIQNSSNINLFGLFKANTYTIQFDINNTKGDSYYLDYGTGTYTADFTSDMIGFRTKSGINNSVITNCVCYVTFDTNLWYISNSVNETLLYSYKGNPYTVEDMANSGTNRSKLIVDMFGYSWLGWYYTKINDIRQGNAINTVTLILASYYLNTKIASSLQMPVFDLTQITAMRNENSIFDDNVEVKDFNYYGQHKLSNNSLNAANGYIYFYKYTTETDDMKHININGFTIDYYSISDYLNSFETRTENIDGVNITLSAYSKRNDNAIILSYYDTCLSANSYGFVQNGSKFYLTIDKSFENMRVIKLFAYWSQNKYTTVYDRQDASTNDSVNHLGSSTANFTATASTYYFNDTNPNNTSYLDGYLLANIPNRIGYDFVGWSFSYIPPTSTDYETIADIINAPSSKLYLCKELFTQYSALSDLDNTSNLESNILMIKGNLLTKSGDSDWLFNLEGNSEHLGDQEDERYRYIYIFAIWKPQTFSINISLNIDKENLSNLYDMDSSFAVSLFENDGKSADECYKTATGVNSKFYSYYRNKANTMTSYSYYNNYFEDIIANVCFEIEFDQRFDTAKLSFAGKTYGLKDLFATSAGYYFLGLMYKNTYSSDNDYIVKNTLNSVLKLDSGLVNENDDGDVSLKKDADNNLLSQKLDNTFYLNLRNTKYVSLSSSKSNDSSITDYNSASASSNFGYLYMSSGKRYYIMSEVVDGQTYLFIIYKNVKYYVVYFEQTGSNTFKDSIVADRTFLYYKSVTDQGTNRYVIRFKSDGTPYYVDDTYGNMKTINSSYLRIAVYAERRNTLKTYLISGVPQLKNYDSLSYPDGSLVNVYSTGVSSILGGGTYSLINKTTREFTLYAHWGIRTVTSTIVNGNNAWATTSTSSSNAGLAGYYKISSESLSSTTSSVNEEKISLEHNYYTTASYTFLPYFNGRYLSELKIEFDSLTENSSDYTSSFNMKHETVILKLKWNNDSHTITIDNVVYNDIDVNNAVDVAKSYTAYVLNRLKGISILSLLDYYNLFDERSSSDGLKLYKNNKYTDSIVSNRKDINAVTLKLTNIMTSVKFTCKFSIQTYQVNIYSVVLDNSSRPDTNNTTFITPFSSMDELHEHSNYNADNRLIYGDPYLSSEDRNGKIATISEDCSNLSVETYNVPYFYFITNFSDNNDKNNSIKNRIDYVKSNQSNYYGFEYIYSNNNYKRGSLTSYITQQHNNALSSSAVWGEIALGQYELYNWYTASVENSKVKLNPYEYTNEIVNNTTIYGLYFDSDAPMKFLFYYYDNDAQKYVQYKNNESYYTSGTSGSLVQKDSSGYYITKLPSPNIDSWYSDGNEKYQFVGYVYFDSTSLNSFKLESYDTSYYNKKYQYATEKSDTTGDAYSAFATGKVGTTFNNTQLNYIYSNYISSLTYTDLFKYKLSVSDYKYFPMIDQNTKSTKKVSVNGVSCSILDYVRLGVNINYKISSSDYYLRTATIYKDFPVLNISTRISDNNSKTIYCIPIYEVIDLSIVDCNIYEKNLNLTTNTNMIHSCVFDTNSSYTIFYPANELKLVISESSNLTVNDISVSSTSIYRDYIVKDIKINDNKFTIDFSSSTYKNNKTYYVYAYYLKGVQSREVAFIMSNSISITKTSSSSLTLNSAGMTGKAQIKMADSPLDITLNSTYQGYYNNACAEIDAGNETDNQKEYRKKVVYIALQIRQSGVIFYDYAVHLYSISYEKLCTLPGTIYNSNHEQQSKNSLYSLQSCIDVINNYNGITTYFSDIYHKKSSGDYELSPSNRLRTDCYGFIRLVYALTDYYFDNIQNHSVVNYDDITGLFNDSAFENIGILPGDIMKDDRSDKNITVYDINGVSNTYNTGTANKHVALYLYSTSSAIYYIDESSVSSTLMENYNRDLQDNSAYEIFTASLEYKKDSQTKTASDESLFDVRTGDLYVHESWWLSDLFNSNKYVNYDSNGNIVSYYKEESDHTYYYYDSDDDRIDGYTYILSSDGTTMTRSGHDTIFLKNYESGKTYFKYSITSNHDHGYNSNKKSSSVVDSGCYWIFVYNRRDIINYSFTRYVNIIS